MSLRLKPYHVMKDSGVPWLGVVPEHWGVRRIKALFREKDERSGDGRGVLLSLTRARGIVPQAEASKRIASAEDLSRYKVCRSGDLVMNRMQAWSGMFAVSSLEGLVSPDYSVFCGIGKQEVKYFEHLFKTPLLVNQFAQRSKGIGSGFNRLYTPDFGAVPVTTPPLCEQSVIVRFLDDADRRVRRYIRAGRRLIELLKEQKQAIIQRAVTRGLDPNVRLKASGIGWLPAIPEHWSAIRLGSVAESLQTGPFGSQLHAGEYQPNGTPVINPSHMNEGRINPDPACAVDARKAAELRRHRLQPGDILFARRGELGRCALVTPHEQGWLCGTGSLRMRTRGDLADPEYLVRLLLSKGVAQWLSLQSIGSTMENLNPGILSRLPLPLPPRGEQGAILEYITERRATFDSALQLVRREVDLVREYRTRLIADAVTGKLDVRSIELPQPEEAEELAPVGDEIADNATEEGDELEPVEEVTDAAE